jgi:hypothetical protein
MKLLFLILMVLGVSQVVAQVMPAPPASARASFVEEDKVAQTADSDGFLLALRQPASFVGDLRCGDNRKIKVLYDRDKPAAGSADGALVSRALREGHRLAVKDATCNQGVLVVRQISAAIKTPDPVATSVTPRCDLPHARERMPGCR